MSKKKKKENMQHMTLGTHTINRSPQPCVDVTLITPCVILYIVFILNMVRCLRSIKVTGHYL